MPHLQIYAFGRLRLQYGQAEISSFPTRHVEELLGYLVLHPRVHHSREKLIDLLWPYSSLANARGRFSTVLWRLRAVFDEIGAPSEHYLQVTREWIAFDPDQLVTLDANDFEQLLNQTLTASARQEELLRTAVALYQGDLYESIYADWCLLERERMARYYLRAMGQLMACLMQRQEYEEAVTLGAEILQYDPIREEVHRALMYCYWQMGQPARAVRQFERCAHLLNEELQSLPMSETITLHRQIMSDRLCRLPATAVQPERNRAQLMAAFHDFEQAGERLNQLFEGIELN